MKIKKVLLIILITVFITSCKTTKIEDTETVYIMVYDFENNVLKDVQVNLDGEKKGFSDVYGRFALSIAEDDKKHTVELSKENYETISFETKLDKNQVLYFKIGNADYYAKMAENSLDAVLYAEAKKYIEIAVSINPRKDYLYLKEVIENKKLQ